jgi:hypothetical protein
MQARIPELMDEVGLSDRVLIEKYLKALLEAEETKFFAIRNRLVSGNVISIFDGTGVVQTGAVVEDAPGSQ